MCLSAATQHSYDAIILYIKGSTLSKSISMIELCAELKKNFHTHASPVLAVCFSVNRRIVERLTAAGADFVVFGQDPEKLCRADESTALMDQLKEAHRSGQVLARLCPYLDYSSINDDQELTTCRAYANWLVLGPRMLRELCQTPGHLNCMYYQNPRLPKQVPGAEGRTV